MKTFIHNMRDTDICIYEIKDGILRGSFFSDKPEIGDVIKTHTIRETNFYRMFEVTEIIENVDAVVQKGCTHNPKLASFTLRLVDVTDDVRFLEINNKLK